MSAKVIEVCIIDPVDAADVSEGRLSPPTIIDLESLQDYIVALKVHLACGASIVMRVLDE